MPGQVWTTFKQVRFAGGMERGTFSGRIDKTPGWKGVQELGIKSHNDKKKVHSFQDNSKERIWSKEEEICLNTKDNGRALKWSPKKMSLTYGERQELPLFICKIRIFHNFY